MGEWMEVALYILLGVCTLFILYSGGTGSNRVILLLYIGILITIAVESWRELNYISNFVILVYATAIPVLVLFNSTQIPGTPSPLSGGSGVRGWLVPGVSPGGYVGALMGLVVVAIGGYAMGGAPNGFGGSPHNPLSINTYAEFIQGSGGIIILELMVVLGVILLVLLYLALHLFPRRPPPGAPSPRTTPNPMGSGGGTWLQGWVGTGGCGQG